VDEGLPVSFHVPPGTEEIKLIALAEPLADASEGPLARLHCVLEATWLDIDDEVLIAQELSVHAGRSSYPRSVRSAAPPPPVLDPRTVRLGVPDARANRLVLTIPEGSEPVRVRGFRSLPDRALDNDGLVGLGRRDAVRLARRIGLHAWAGVHHAEAAALASQRWEAMRPLYGTEAEVHGTITNVVDPTMPAQVRRAAGVTLPAGRAVAWRLKGPIDVLAVGDGPVEALEAEAIARDHGEVPLQIEPVPAPAWAAGTTALRLRTDTTAEVSLTLTHLGDRTLHDLLLVTRGRVSEVLPADAEAAPLDALLPDLVGSESLSLIPTFTFLPVHVLDPGAPHGWVLPGSPARDVVRLSLRPLRDDPAVSADAELSATVHYADGHVDTLDLSAPFVPSPYERLGRTGDAWEPGTWVGDPIRRFVHLGPGAVAVEVHTTGDRIAVTAEAPGVPEGTESATSPTGTTRSRYPRRTRSSWSRLPPLVEDTAGETMLVWANLREELTTPGGPDGDGQTGPMSIASFASGRIADRVWLIPPAPQPELPTVPRLAEATQPPVHGLVYCGYRPAPWSQPFPLDRDAIDRTGGFLASVLWADALGGRYTVDLHGDTWLEGRVRAEVQRRRSARPPAANVGFSAPSGTRLWLRTWLHEGDACPDPHRPRTTRTLRPGASAVVRIERTLRDHLVLVGALGADEANLRARILQDGLDLARTSSEAWTRPLHLLSLEADGRVAQGLDEPWRTATVLRAAGLRMGADLPLGTVPLELTNLGDTSLEVYVLVEGAEVAPNEIAIGRAPR
jgi:hypothetical protein